MHESIILSPVKLGSIVNLWTKHGTCVMMPCAPPSHWVTSCCSSMISQHWSTIHSDWLWCSPVTVCPGHILNPHQIAVSALTSGHHLLRKHHPPLSHPYSPLQPPLSALILTTQVVENCEDWSIFSLIWHLQTKWTSLVKKFNWVSMYNYVLTYWSSLSIELPLTISEDFVRIKTFSFLMTKKMLKNFPNTFFFWH